MDPIRWERIQALFHQAAALPEAERPGFLSAECGEDRDLRDDVQELLAEDAAGSPVLDRGVDQAADQVLGRGALPREEFGPYRVTGVLGEGGMGVVYLAERRDLGSVAAIKILRDAALSPARRERFANEQRTLAQLRHPAIAQLYDADTLPNGTPWFVMEYVDGVPLTTYCRTRATSIPGRLQLLRAVCEAVQHAHQHAVIHRDLKPSNILVKADGTVKLLDFGIAKQLENLDQPMDQTSTGLRLLTPAYAAPELIRGEAVGIHTDIYALGVILYELLTDRLPFDLAHRTPAEAMSLIVEQEPARPSVVHRLRGAARPARRRVSRAAWADLDVLCLTAMHKDAARRYRTVEALLGDIDRFLEGAPLEARPDTLGYRAGKFVRRHRAAVLAAGTVAALVILLVTFYTFRLAAERNMARQEAAKATQLSNYLISLFEASDPFRSDTAAVDLRVLLARGADRAEALADQPGAQATMFDALGQVHTRLSRYDQAEAQFRRALAIRRRHGTPLELAATLGRLGAMYRYTGVYDSAETYLREALALREGRLRPTNPDLATNLSDLGVILNNTGRLDEAETLHRRTLELRRGIHSGPHHDLAASLNNLGVNLAAQGDYAAAEPLLREALAMSVALYGPDHPNMAMELANLGVVLEAREDYGGADSVMSAALEIRRRHLGDDHYETAFNLSQLGGMLRRKGDYERAEAHLRQAVAIQERVLGPGHRDVGVSLNHLGQALRDQSRFREAAPILRRSREIFGTTLGDRHPFTGFAGCQYAYALHRDGGGPAAVQPLFAECLAILDEGLPEGHELLLGTRGLYGEVLTRWGRYPEAEGHLLASHQQSVARFGASHADTRRAALRLALLYDAWDRPDEAARFRAEPADTVRLTPAAGR